MEFSSMTAVILFLVVMGIFMGVILPKFTLQTRTVDTPSTIFEAAQNGETKMLVFSPDLIYNICEQFDARHGCYENEVGVEGDCELERDKTYKIVASPLGTGVCLNVSLVGEVNE